MIYRLMIAIVACVTSFSWAMTWLPTLDSSPTLHTTGMEVIVQLKSPLPARAIVAISCMNENQWRTELPVDGQKVIKKTLTPSDFTFETVKKDWPKSPLQFSQVRAVDVTVDGKTDAGIASVDVKFTGNDGVVYPWEKDPAPVAKEKGRTYWPGMSRTSGGHFGWRYEPNGLLINNVSFNSIDRWWYYFKPSDLGDGRGFQFNFGIPGALTPEIKTVAKGDYEQNKAGLASRQEYIVDKGVYAADEVHADWTSFRWKRNVKTKSGQTFVQELRYSAMGIGVQVETNCPSFELSYQSRKTNSTHGPTGIAIPKGNSVSVINATAGFDPKRMSENWIVLLGAGVPEEIPVLVVFQHRPDRLEFTRQSLILHRKGGVGTLAIETPCMDGNVDRTGASLAMTGTYNDWQVSPGKIPVKHLAKMVGLMTAYPWKCDETFAVADGEVHIRDKVEFLPWKDDWNSQPTPYAPIPPFVAYSILRDYIPHQSVADVEDLNIPTKWGPYVARKGNEVDYRLPVPDPWDYYPLGVSRTDKNAWLYDVLANSIARAEIEKVWGGYDTLKNLAPSFYPHCSAHDQSVGALHASNFMPNDDHLRLRQLTSNCMQSSLFPQNYRLRRDPLTGERHVACTAWGNSDYTVNGENSADTDYWQGITLYGIFVHAKYNAMWDTLAKYWPTIRSLVSYWEGLHSWALMSPGAREAGEIYGGDMTAAGYEGMVGFYGLAKRLGTPYQRDLAAYLLALNAVPRVAMFGFMDWAHKIQHPELYGTFSAGFGERWVTSIKSLSNDVGDMSAKDPWWGTGPIGPQGSAPELLDLFVKRAPKDAADWEGAFMKQCPDSGFINQRPDNTLSHVMFRMYLSDSLYRQALAFMKNSLHKQHMFRHTHVLAGLLAWDVPVRLLDWAPAYVADARWDENTRTARMKFEMADAPATIRLAVKNKSAAILMDGQPVKVTQVGQWQEWHDMAFTIPPG